MQPAGDPSGDSDDSGDRVLVLNPVSGAQDHVDDTVELAADHDFAIRRTEAAGDAKQLACEAAPDADLIAAVGGDGTINEVVNGIVAADELETTTLGVIPAGTGNNFATNIGIEGIEHGFEVLERGRRRRIDLGVANDRAFVNSCVGGVTAEASGATTPEGKREFGVLAYVKATLETVAAFESLSLRVEITEEETGTERAWEGNAMFVLVGNCRRFTSARAAQANVEDGRFEVTIVEDVSPSTLLGDAALDGLFDRGGEHIVRRQTPSLTIECLDGPVEYSLDGELLEAATLELETIQQTLNVAVGESYQPDPDAVDGPDAEPTSWASDS
ncbi:diacylglycerol/lipid kinase family protein [Natrialba sp. SSL1]|uniref:diacylglycerol/lipid kinase family protein n=1 Tax=Natrialba sp. SSL1 TaxID=1869245 RepID=UPI0008F87F5A|nr:YegS/Rv2252/BmrU family lipid kinase [Natrialba sp. SSL1]OIB57471.1 diacylglycerol kinase [Natrialba sp. SSL1]